MKKIGKKYKSAKEAIPAEKQSKSEAISLCKNNAPANFDESVDVAFSLGIDPKDAEQNIRTTVSLPNGTGKDVRIAVFAGGEALTEAESAGAEIVGGKDLATKVASEQKLDADIVISTPEMMAEVAKAVEDFKKGKVEIKNDKLGNVHLSIGKVSFDEAKLAENLDEVIAVLTKAKPSSSKGEFIKTVYMSSTMGPSISVDINI